MLVFAGNGYGRRRQYFYKSRSHTGTFVIQAASFPLSDRPPMSNIESEIPAVVSPS